MSKVHRCFAWPARTLLAGPLALLLASCSVSEPPTENEVRAGAVTYVRSYSVDPLAGSVAVAPTGEITYVSIGGNQRDHAAAFMFRTRHEGTPAWTRTLTVPVDPPPQLGIFSIVDAVPDERTGHVHVLASFHANEGTVVVQVDAQGRAVSRRQYGSLGPYGRTEGSAITSRPGGGFVVAGRFGSESTGFGLWMLEVGNDGIVVRERRMPPTDHSIGESGTIVAVDKRSGIKALIAVDGGYLVSGTRGDLPWLARVDSTLAIDWERRLSTSHGFGTSNNSGSINRALRLPADSTFPATYVGIGDDSARNIAASSSNRETITRFNWRDGTSLWTAHWRHASPASGAIMADAIVDRQGRLVSVGIAKPCNPVCEGEGPATSLVRVFRPQGNELVRTHQFDLATNSAGFVAELQQLRIAMNAGGDYFVLSQHPRLELLRISSRTFDDPPVVETAVQELSETQGCGPISSLQPLPPNRLLVVTESCLIATDEQGNRQWMLPASQSVAASGFEGVGWPYPAPIPLTMLADGGTVVALTYRTAEGVQTLITRRSADGNERWSRSIAGQLGDLVAVDASANPADHGLIARRLLPGLQAQLLRIELNDGRVSSVAPSAARLSGLLSSQGGTAWVIRGVGQQTEPQYQLDRIGATGEVTASFLHHGRPDDLALLPDGTNVSVLRGHYAFEAYRSSPLASEPAWSSSVRWSASQEAHELGLFMVVALPDGGAAIAAGLARQSGTQCWHGSEDIILVRLDRAGQKVFARRFGTAGCEGPRSLTAMPDGGFLITGWTTGFETGRMTLLAIRTDADGRVGTDCIAVQSGELALEVVPRQPPSRPFEVAITAPPPPEPVDSTPMSLAGTPGGELLSARACIAPSLAPVLRVSTVGNGTVTSMPSGITCGPDSAGICAQAYATGTAVRLDASTTAPYVFAGWLGHCSDAASAPSAMLVLDQSATCEARFAPPDAAPSVTYADTNFDDGAWAVVDVRVQPLLAVVGATWRQQIDGGNPGAYREMHDQITPGVLALSVLHVHAGAIYEPARQGAIASLHYSEDRAVLNAPAGAVVQSQMLIEQEGRIFVAMLGSASAFSHSDWRTANASLQAADFQQLSGTSCAAGHMCPDFSASGGPLRFGYLRGINRSAGAGALELTHGIDNWRVTVHRSQ